MALDRPLADEQRPRDLLGGHAAGGQPGHFPLPAGQRARSQRRGGCPPPAAVQAPQRVQGPGLAPRAAAFAGDRGRALERGTASGRASAAATARGRNGAGRGAPASVQESSSIAFLACSAAWLGSPAAAPPTPTRLRPCPGTAGPRRTGPARVEISGGRRRGHRITGLPGGLGQIEQRRTRPTTAPPCRAAAAAGLRIGARTRPRGPHTRPERSSYRANCKK